MSNSKEKDRLSRGMDGKDRTGMGGIIFSWPEKAAPTVTDFTDQNVSSDSGKNFTVTKVDMNQPEANTDYRTRWQSRKNKEG